MPTAQDYTLPTPGATTPEDSDSIVGWVNDCTMEAYQYRQKFEPGWDNCYRYYLGKFYDTNIDGISLLTDARVEQITSNRILIINAALAATQMQQSPKVRLSPRESLEPATYYFNTQVDVKPNPLLMQVMKQIGPDALMPQPDPNDPNKTVPPRALNKQEVAVLETAITQSEQIEQQSQGVNAGWVPSEILVGVTDRVAAEAVQTVFDAKWDESGCDKHITENILNNGIFGHQGLVYEFEEERQRHLLRNPEPFRLFIDPTATTIDAAHYVVFDQVLSVDQACAIYPDLEEEIIEHGNVGLQATPGFTMRQPFLYTYMNFRRPMVVLRTMWIRWQKYPLTAQEAEAKGLVELRTDTVAAAPQCTCGAGEDAKAEDHEPDCACRTGYEAIDSLSNENQPQQSQLPADSTDILSQTEQGDEKDDVRSVDEEQGQDSSPAQLSPQAEEASGNEVPVQDQPDMGGTDGNLQTRQYFILVATGEETDPTKENWPTRSGIRQIRILGGDKVEDKECEFADIPICMNKNDHTPFCIYGMGEPEKLIGLQRALNNVLSDAINHLKQHSEPPEYMSQSTYDALQEAGQDAYTGVAGRQYVIPDDIWVAMNGNVRLIGEVAPVSADVWRVLDYITKTMDEISGHNEVMQGRASASWSGEAIKALQGAATGVVGLKSRNTEEMIKSLVHLMIPMLVHRMTPEDWGKYVSKYPVHVLYALQERAKLLDVDIEVEISSGTGLRKQMDQASDLQLYDRKLLSPITMLEAANKNPKVEAQNWATWNREMAQSAGMVPQPTQGTEQPQQAPQQPQPQPQ